MARNSGSKKKGTKGLQPVDPKKIMLDITKRQSKKGRPVFPQTVRPGRCGGCDIRI